jgi:arabinogalactan endo-1,4-beta-galactosidase
LYAKKKMPAGLIAGGHFNFSNLSGLLDQAMAVRRHWGPVMVVVLHLLKP